MRVRISVIVLSLLGAVGLFAFDTPDTGVTWSMDDLVANSAGAVTGASGVYALTENLNILETDTITMAAGDVLNITAGSGVTISVYGRLNAVGTDTTGITFTSASGTPAVSDWNGIYMEETGSANLAYCTISYADYPLYFEMWDLFEALASTVSHCTITSSNYGIYLDGFNSDGLTVSNTTVDGSSYGVYATYVGEMPVVFDTCTFTNSSNDGIYLYYGCENFIVKNCTITGNSSDGIEVYDGAWDLEVTECTITGNSGYGIYIDSDDETGGDGMIITNNTISNNDYGIYGYNGSFLTVTGNTFDGNTNNAIYLDFSWGNKIENNTITNNGDGIYLYDGIETRKGKTAGYSWIEVNENNADDWLRDVDDDYLSEAAIGFDFPVDGTLYTHFQVQSNAALELAVGSGNTNNIDDYESRAYIIDSYPDSTVIFANCDDYCDSSSPAVNELHNGVTVNMDGFGYKYFDGSGTADGDGNAVNEECLVIRWYMPYIDDPYDTLPAGYWNDFEVIIYPDGRVRWNTKAMNGYFPEYAQYSGMYVGANAKQFEVMVSTSRPADTTSFLYDPNSYTDISTNIKSNTITNSGDGVYFEYQEAGNIEKNTVTDGDNAIFLDYSLYNSVFDNTVTGNAAGIYLDFSDENSVTYNVLDDNDSGITLTNSDTNDIKYNSVTNGIGNGIVLGTTNGNTVDGNTVTGNDVGLWIADSTSDTITNNNLNDNITWLLQNTTAGAITATGNFWGDSLADAAAIDAVIQDDDEGAFGVVTFDPYLTAAYEAPPKPGKKSGGGGGCSFNAEQPVSFSSVLGLLAMTGLFFLFRKNEKN